VLQITLGKIMKGIVVLKRLMVEWVVVKGATEELIEDGKIDMWGESRYKVFRKVTENANAAMLHFYSPAYPELAIRSFLVSYKNFDMH
jgi:mediator of RNA polymerase II transcription subunit 27